MEDLHGKITHWFTYHDSSAPEQVASFKELRKFGEMLAQAIALHCPPCADQTAAIRKVREAVMTANAAIACGGR